VFRFNKTYFILSVILFLLEVYIAVYIHDAIIRPYAGDLLVVIFLYCLIRAFVNASVLKTAIAVLLFAYLIEFTQYIHLVRLLGWQHSRLANVVMGNSFQWIDMAAYTLGIVVVLIAERARLGRKQSGVV